MSRCLDLDRLVAVGAAIDWQVDEVLDHLGDCAECRAELQRLASVHSALSEEEEPRPGLVDDVMADLLSTEAKRTALLRIVSVSLNTVLAGATAFFAIAMAAAATPPIQLGPVALGAAMLVAVGTAWWNGRQQTASA